MRIGGGRFRCLRTLGEGGAGKVWLALDEAAGREVALKCVALDDDALASAFAAELGALRGLVHPNLVRLLDVGIERRGGERIGYYAAPVLEGDDLATYADGRRWNEVRPRLLEALAALLCLHRAGLVHGDFAPKNVRVHAGRAVLIDLSCARTIAAPIERVGGTLEFIAPECFEGHGDARADLFAIGVTLAKLAPRIAGGLPHDVEALAQRLRRADPAERPSDLHEVFEALGERAPGSRADAAPLVGRKDVLAQWEQTIAALRSGRAGTRALTITGPSGIGRSRVLAELKWRAQLAVAVDEAIDGVSAMLARIANAPVRHVPDAIALLATLRAQGEPRVLIVDDLHLDPDRALIDALRSLLREDDPFALVVGELTAPRGVSSTVLRPLTSSEVEEWARGRWPLDRLGELARTTGGLPAEIAAALRRGDDDDAATERFTARLSIEARARLAELALGATLEEDEHVRELERLGLAVVEARGARLAVRSSAGEWQRALGDAAIAAAHRRLASAAKTVADRIRHAAAGGQLAIAEDELLASACDPSLASGAHEVARRSTRWDAILRAAAILESAGRHGDAAHALASAARRTRSVDPRAYLLAASCASKLGRPRAALRHLARSTAAPFDRALETARAYVQSGAYRDAANQARAALALDRSHSGASELLGIALSYLDDDEAPIHLERAAARATDPRAKVRALSYRAIFDYRKGRLTEAAAGYAQALAVARAQGAADHVASASLNLGTIEHRRGRFGPALELYEEALSLAVATAKHRTEAALRTNLAQLHLELGAFERALNHAERGRDTAATHDLPFSRAVARLVEAEVRWRLGHSPEEALADARNGFGTQSVRELAELHLLRGRIAMSKADVSTARLALEEADRAIQASGAADLRARWRGLRASLADADGRFAEAAADLDEAIRGAESAGEVDLAATLRAFAAQVATKAGARHVASEHRRAALATWERCAIMLEPALRDRFFAHPDRAIERPAKATRRASASSSELQRLLALASRINRSLDADEVLEVALDAAIELTGAERGFVLLRASDGVEIAAARHFDREHLAGPSARFSRSIAERVIASGEPLVTAEAQTDERFASERSIHAMRLRSVVCVPVRSREGMLGALYLDNRLQIGRFGPSETQLLAGFADHVAIALTNARLHRELEERTRELEAERARITDLLAHKTREVERLHQRVGHADGFYGIVGRSPGMRALFATLERLAQTSVTVLVQGVSGSGKELVARALHDAGPRRDQPFIAVNCGAIAETLLESELFGHVRGAFTGADRDRTGLFVVAGEGTIFLDEVGEMSEAMQVKLLRALEQREVRPVGGHASIPIAARIVCATNRDLAREVEAKRFREDLYYRLAVVLVRVPALRERREDIPLLARALLARDADAAHTLTRDALARLSAYDWPGNVRQLDNVLRAAAVFARGGRIDAADLTLPTTRSPRSRPAEAEDERTRIERALERHRWNVSEVSRELGIPRMTLYRRLRQYELRRDPASDAETP